MTMGFRNRLNPSRARHDASPLTGRIVVAVVGVLTIVLGAAGLTPLTLCIPLAAAGLYGASFRSDLFE